MTEIALTKHELSQVIAFVDRVIERAYRMNWNAANARHRTLAQERRDKINGFCAEVAFCRYLGVEWTPDIDAFHARPDVLNCFEVRTTHHEHGGLIIGDDELPCRRCFVLLTGDVWIRPVMTLRGYLWGSQVNGMPRLRQGHRPGYLVPQRHLWRILPDTRDRMLSYGMRSAAC